MKMIFTICEVFTMTYSIVLYRGVSIAVVRSDEPVITDAGSALDLMMSVAYNDGCDRIMINKEAVAEDFFCLRTGIAGEILQKFANYHKKIAIVGGFGGYDSKALHDFIYECNTGGSIFFSANEAEAMDKLSPAE